MRTLSLLALSIASILNWCCTTHKPGIAIPASSSVTTAKPPQIPGHVLVSDKDLDVLLDSIGNARVVLLGEDSHGTGEYYRWRAAITKRLIQEKGFDIVALEADWADTYRLNNLLTGIKKDSSEVVALLKQYDRWPQWLWANEEFVNMLQWMNTFAVTANKKISIYGLDVYSFEEALDTIIANLHNKPTLQIAQNVKQCLRPYNNDALEYQRAVKNGSANCGDAVNRLWLYVNNLTGANKTNNDENFLLHQNARVVFNGERYFRGTVQNRIGAWNIRDRHMAETVKALLDHGSNHSKIIVWAHNTHVGDARFTDMPGRGRSNVGEMLRKQYGNENVFIVGFGSYKGSVIAAQKWDTTYQTMAVAPARTGSIEQLLHADGGGNKMIFMKDVENNPLFDKWLLQRAIGVVENPKNGLLGSYVSSQIQKRYNAFIFFDDTHPLHPLH